MSDKNVILDPETAPKAVIKKEKRISSIWILPILAVLVGSWLIYKGIVEAPIDVIITFESAEGLVAGKTKVLFKGLEAGTVSEIKPSVDFIKVDAVVEFDRRAKPLLVSSTRFWLVKPQVSLRGIAGLGTILSGDYIAMQPGKKGVKTINRFIALPEPPPLLESTPGLHLTLISNNFDSFERGTSVYYKKIEVGEVVSCDLSVEKKQTKTKIYIQPDYSNLVNKDSLFYNASGIDMQGSLTGFTLRTQSLASIILGGIAFSSPQHSNPGTQAGDNETFILYESYEIAHQDGIAITLLFDTAEGLSKGTKIKYHGIDVGEVQDINFGKSFKTVRLQVYLEKNVAAFAREGTRFWVVKPEISLSKVSNLGTLVTGHYIELSPSKKKGAPKDEFKGLSEPPVMKVSKKDLQITLTTDRRGSIKTGNEIFYREVSVGRVIGYELADTADKILIKIEIEKRYAPLVRKNSVFWNASGISVHAGLFSGVQVNTESLKAILEGGVAFATPDNDDMGEQAKQKAIFELHHEMEDKWLEWKPVIDLTK
jgi:paraquat-inducible protein B